MAEPVKGAYFRQQIERSNRANERFRELLGMTELGKAAIARMGQVAKDRTT